MDALKRFVNSFAVMFKKTPGYEPVKRKTKFPIWAKKFRFLTKNDMNKSEFNRIVAETRAFKGFYLWNKRNQAMEILSRLRDHLGETNRFVIEAYSQLTKIPMNKIILEELSLEEAYRMIDETPAEEAIYLKMTKKEAKSYKAEIEERWKEKLWQRFIKNTNLALQYINENDIFHAESYIMEIVFTFDTLNKERAAFIYDKYVEAYGVNLNLLVSKKGDERAQVDAFIDMFKQHREVHQMLDSLIQMQMSMEKEDSSPQDDKKHESKKPIKREHPRP